MYRYPVFSLKFHPSFIAIQPWLLKALDDICGALTCGLPNLIFFCSLFFLSKKNPSGTNFLKSDSYVVDRKKSNESTDEIFSTEDEKIRHVCVHTAKMVRALLTWSAKKMWKNMLCLIRQIWHWHPAVFTHDEAIKCLRKNKHFKFSGANSKNKMLLRNFHLALPLSAKTNTFLAVTGWSKVVFSLIMTEENNPNPIFTVFCSNF